MNLFAQFALVGVGGGLGAMARYGVGIVVYHYIERPWIPYATAIVNILGCFLIGIAAGYLEARTSTGDVLRLVAMAGFLGGFTTFSTFGLETIQLLRAGHGSGAIFYVLTQLLVGVGLAALGYAIATNLWRQV